MIRRKIACVVTFAITLAMTTGVIDRMEKSCRITSSVNSNPPIGALKIALTPAAVPQAMTIGIDWRASPNIDPTPDAMPAPI